MPTVTIEQAQTHLPELIDQLQPGEALVITRNEKPVARLTAAQPPLRQPRRQEDLRSGKSPGVMRHIGVVKGVRGDDGCHRAKRVEGGPGNIVERGR